MQKQAFISIVIPTLNEAITIGPCITKAKRALQDLQLPGEVIISDSYSTDKTVAIAKKHGARIVYQPLLGYGNAYHKGISEAKGNIIIMGDADNTYDFSDIEKFIRPLEKNTCDMVMGNRLNKTIEHGAMPWAHRYIGTPTMTWVVNLLFKTNIRDCNCGMRSFTKTTYEKMNLKSPGWEFASEMVIKAGLLGLRIKNVDITLHKDMQGRVPHLNPWKAAAKNFLLMFTFSARFLFMIPGILLTSIGGILLTILFAKPDPVVITFGVFGINHLGLIAAIFMFLAGGQLIWFSLITRIYIYHHRLHFIDTFIKKLLKTPITSIPCGIGISILLFMLGATTGMITLYEWSKLNFTTAPQMKLFIVSCGLLFAAIQTFFNYFMVNILLEEIRFTLGTEGTKTFRKKI